MTKSFRTIFFLLGLLSAGAAQAGPVLGMSEMAFDFGYVPQQSRVSHVFWLYSQGDETLQIEDVKPGCSCTLMPLEKRTLPAGDSTRLEIIFKSVGYLGPVKKTPKVITNEGPNAQEIMFRSVVVSDSDTTFPLIINPFKLDLAPSNRGVDRKEFTITNASDQPLKLSLIDFPANLMSVELPAKLAAGESGKGLVILKPVALTMPLQKSFTIEVNDETTTRFTVPVKRVITEDTSKPDKTKK